MSPRWAITALALAALAGALAAAGAEVGVASVPASGPADAATLAAPQPGAAGGGPPAANASAAYLVSVEAHMRVCVWAGDVPMAMRGAPGSPSKEMGSLLLPPSPMRPGREAVCRPRHRAGWRLAACRTPA